MKSRFKWHLAILSLSLLVTSCMVGPDYVPPETSVPDVWDASSLAGDVVQPCEEPVTEWWEGFCDPLLTHYIELGVLFNNDILVAEMNVLQARALRQMTASQLFPQISADFNVTRTYFSKNGPVFAIGAGETNSVTGLPFQLQIPQIQNIFTALLEATWQIDLFGKIRRSIQAADATVGSFIEQLNDTVLSVITEIAINYMEIRSAQQMGLLIEENIELLEKNVAVVQKQLKSGYRNSLDVERIEAELAAVEANLPNTLSQIFRGIYALSILTGQLPEALVEALLPIQPLPQPPCEIAVGLRSDLLRRRPDVRNAERQLAASVANIGVAVASFFPTITLNGDIGFQSLNLNNLFQSQSKTWAIGGDVNMPIFQGGYLVGNLRLSEAEAAAAAFTYQQTVLRALQEAESALVYYTQDLKTIHQLQEAVEKYGRVVKLTDMRYTRGLVNLIDFLDTERQWNSAKQNLLNGETTALLDLISLYRALGGGWEVEGIIDECVEMRIEECCDANDDT